MNSIDRNPDVIFLSYDEPNADANFRRLKRFAPHAKRVHGVRGILEAYRSAAASADSDHFFVVEADNWISNDFDFVSRPPGSQVDVCLWQSVNSVNRLRTFYGSVKLIRRSVMEALEQSDESAVDFFLTMKVQFEAIEQIASEARFNATPFLAWRGGFRECAKLAGGIMGNGPGQSAQLEHWQTVGGDRLNGEWCIGGARMGASFGRQHFGNTDAISQINDVEWLKRTYEASRSKLADIVA